MCFARQHFSSGSLYRAFYPVNDLVMHRFSIHPWYVDSVVTQTLNSGISDLINIIVVSIFSHHVQEEGFSFGHSFWSTICSTIISSITNFTLILDLILTTNFQSSGRFQVTSSSHLNDLFPGSGLTRTQRSLVIVIITLLCFLALGGLINSILLGISFLDALYFSVTTIETIGMPISLSTPNI